jgi:hypothetical protein
MSRATNDLSAVRMVLGPGIMYAANTIGAIIGAAAAGLVLIEVLGLSETLVVAAGCSALAGLTAIVLDRRRRASGSDVAQAASTTTVPETTTIPTRPQTRTRGPDRAGRGVRLRPDLARVPVLWTRLLASGSGNYAYVFTLILVVFLPASRSVRCSSRCPAMDPTSGRPAGTDQHRDRRPGSPERFVPGNLQYTVQQGRIDGIIGVLFSQALLVVLPATIVMALSFPASSALVAGRSGKIATSAGLLLAANTARRHRRDVRGAVLRHPGHRCA